MNFPFFKSVNFSLIYGNSNLKEHGFLRKKIKFLFFFPKKKKFREKSLMETQSLFSLYVLFFNFLTLKFDV